MKKSAEAHKKEGKENKKNVWLLGGSSFFNDVGSEMITPILPFFITALGGGGAAVGLIAGLRDGLSNVLKIFGGWLSDREGKRMPLVFLGYFISVVMRFFMGFATSWQYIVAALSLERIGKLRDAPRDAIIAESDKKRGEGFGIQQMMDRAGGVVGTLLVILLFWKFGFGFKTIVFIAAGLSILSLIPLLFVKENKIRPIKRNLVEGVQKLNKKLKYIILVTSVFALANFGLYMFILLKAREVTGSIAGALLLFAGYIFVYSAASIPFGRYSDKIGRKKVLILGYLLFVVVAIGLANSTGLVSLTIIFLLYGLVFAMTEPVQTAYVSDFAGKAKGTALGTYYGTKGITMIVAGVVAGIIWDISQDAMFYYLGIVGIIALILLTSAGEKQQIVEEDD